MKHINYFSPNVKPTSDFAKRQWDWNFLRKMKRKLNNEGKGVTRDDFVNTLQQFGHFTKIRRSIPKVQNLKTKYYEGLRKGRRVPT